MNEEVTTPKRFKWTVEIEVDETWVGDGFDLAQDRCNQIAAELIPWAYIGEVSMKVVSAPDPQEIRKVQGYDDEPKETVWS